MNANLSFLMGPVYAGALHPLHLADLRKSDATADTHFTASGSSPGSAQ